MNNQFSGRIENPQVIEELIADKNSNKLFVFGANWCPDAMNLLQKLNDKSVKKILISLAKFPIVSKIIFSRIFNALGLVIII